MLRFNLRDVLWMTMVVALGAAFWVDRSRLIACRSHAAQLRESLIRARYEVILSRMVADPNEPRAMAEQRILDLFELKEFPVVDFSITEKDIP